MRCWSKPEGLRLRGGNGDGKLTDRKDEEALDMPRDRDRELSQMGSTFICNVPRFVE